MIDYLITYGFFIRDLGGILTRDLQNRNLTFYTAELRGLKKRYKSK